MARILITGMSGAGKSTLLRELARRGHLTVDTDDAGWLDGRRPVAELGRDRGARVWWIDDRVTRHAVPGPGDVRG